MDQEARSEAERKGAGTQAPGLQQQQQGSFGGEERGIGLKAALEISAASRATMDRGDLAVTGGTAGS